MELDDTLLRGSRDKNKEYVGWRAESHMHRRHTKTNKGPLSPGVALLLLWTSISLRVPVCSAAHAAEGEHCADQAAEFVSSKGLLQSTRPKIRTVSKASAPIDEQGKEDLAKDAGKIPQVAAVYPEEITVSSGSERSTATGIWNSFALLWHTWAQRGNRSTALEQRASSVRNGLGGAAAADAIAASLVYAMLAVFFCIVLLGFAFYFLARRMSPGSDADKERELGGVPVQQQQHHRQQQQQQQLQQLQQSVPPSQQVLGQPEELYLCPDLVVPAGCECILLVPTQPMRGQPYNITDSSGNTVLSVTDYAAPATSGGGRSPHRRMLVANGNHNLAQCGRVLPAEPGSTNSTIEFELLTADGEVWAQLSYEPRQGAEDKCTIKTKTHQKLQIFGSVRHNALNVTDAQGGLPLAITEPMVETGPLGEPPCSMFRLRVAPMTDVGLVLCSLICLKHLSISV